MDILGLLARDPVVSRLADEGLRARRITARGAAGSSTTFVAAALAKVTGRPVLLVVAHADDADAAYDELCAAGGVEAARLPALEAMPGESGLSLDALAERLGAVRLLEAWKASGAPPDARPTQANPTGTSATKTLRVMVAPIPALMQGVPGMASLGDVLRTVTVNESIKGGPAGLVRWLDQAGYTRTDAIEEPGEFSVRGGILDVFPPGDPSSAESGDVSMGGVPVRLDFFGDAVEKIVEIDLETMAADRTVRGVQLVAAKAEAIQSDKSSVNFGTLLPPGTLVVLHELMEITEQARGYFERVLNSAGIFGPPAVLKALSDHSAAVIDVTALGQYASGGAVFELPVSAPPALDHEADKAVAELGELARGRDGERALSVTILCQNEGEQQRLGELIAEFAPGAEGLIARQVQYVHQGFIWAGGGGDKTALLLPYSELLHRFTVRRRARGGARLRAGRAMDTFLELQVGDYVVHTEHGIAKFTGLKFMQPRDAARSIEERMKGLGATKEREEEPEEYLTLEFEGSAKLHVPAVKVDQVQKYIGGGGGAKGKPPLSKLGGDRWQNQKARVAESVRDLAAELLRVRAARESMPGIRYPADTAWQKAFEDEFPYEETEDQVASLQEIKRDMASGRPMDRLLCGDVGFGKTELAIRAAFKAAEYGKQVAVLVPTTVLAEQHERTFNERFADYPFKVQSISRFKSDGEIKEVLEELAAGRVDIIIGTHRLLSRDVRFKDLGLVVIDEEQRFGVEHKERLLALRMTVDVLTLSATPIPRTLHLSMLGLRDISSLTTAPVDRRAVVTEVIPYNAGRLKQVIDRELAREGQVFYVHNRVHDIMSVADDVQKLAPTARIVVGHGQMPPNQLEDVMHAFMSRAADILVSTTIIESGIDIPTANTMVIDDADRFGLADLHQLRGRVGRSKHRGYCYLLLPQNRPLREKAKQRLKALEQFSMLGAGFKIAMRDLEIRGAGNILGPEQSGHIAAVGYDMYCQLLDRAVKTLKNEVVAAPSETSIEIGVGGGGVIPKPYIPSDMRRLEAYRRIALAATGAELEKVRADLIAAYGPIPPTTERLLQMAEVRIGARLVGIRSITIRDKDVIFRTTDMMATAEKLQGAPGTVTPLPPQQKGGTAEVYYRPASAAGLEAQTVLAVLRKRLGALPAAVVVPVPEKTSPPMPGIKKPTLPPLSPEFKALRKEIKRGQRPR